MGTGHSTNAVTSSSSACSIRAVPPASAAAAIDAGADRCPGASRNPRSTLARRSWPSYGPGRLHAQARRGAWKRWPRVMRPESNPSTSIGTTSSPNSSSTLSARAARIPRPRAPPHALRDGQRGNGLADDSAEQVAVAAPGVQCRDKTSQAPLSVVKPLEVGNWNAATLAQSRGRLGGCTLRVESACDRRSAPLDPAIRRGLGAAAR